ncbi:MAG: hypothetical protein JWQ90_5103 [Hydrocarboniphaga sp.]|uniref:FG-GAP repeat protein n=1 Tax=Hydrocarboniphaga sp. TaxID=2033016 RepID=UPI002620C635|nr:FG-GAP repeat protein [Hydrocarboniphaga sp.]MDB5972653.1 hypothetical protein [Hydrocarboniphaga sp.]
MSRATRAGIRIATASVLLWSLASISNAAAGSSVETAASKITHGQRVSGSETPQGITAEAWAGIQQQIAKAEYEAAPVPSDPDTISSHNPKQDLQLRFTSEGASFESLRNREPATFGTRSHDIPATGSDAAGRLPLGLQTLSLSRGAQRQAAEAVQPVADGARIEYRRSGWTEWYVNTPAGLEHGYELHRQPRHTSSDRPDKVEPVRIVLAVSGMEVITQADGSLRFTDATGRSLRYDKLVVTDADGRSLPATLTAPSKDRVEIAFDDAAAHYPVTVDPLLVNEDQTISNPDAGGQQFGVSVAISGDTAIVSTPYSVIYIFVHSGNSWAQQARFGGVPGYKLGTAVAISGDTAAAGHGAKDSSPETSPGTVQVYQRTGTVWTPQLSMFSNSVGGFGTSIALGDDTLLVGAPGDDSQEGNQGSAYVFVRSGVSWSWQATLTAADGAPGDAFGDSVALSGDTALISSFKDDIGANVDQGSAYVFKRSGTDWSQQAKLTAADGMPNDQFGSALAIANDTALIGVWLHDVAGNQDQGSAYVFVRKDDSNWQQQATLNFSGSETSAHFGFAVGLTGDVALVGAPKKKTDSGNEGAAYVFVRTASAWSQQAELFGIDGMPGDKFGNAVAASGTDLLVGSPEDDVPDGIDGGSIHFYRIGTDYGDAPSPYPTLLADNGARHFINTDGPYLGSGIDAETDGQPINSGATGDDINNTDDEDGVSFSKLKPGKAASVTVVVTAPAGTAQLDAWMDFNADDDWSDAGEQIFTKKLVNNGSNTLSFTVPATAIVGQTYARFRLSPAGAGGAKTAGKVMFGEVEDYLVKIKAP